MKRNLIAAAVLLALALPTQAANIVDEWASVKAPPPPELKAVTADPKTTALLMLDFVKQFCGPQRYARCPATLPAVKKLLDEARAKGVTVIYTSIPQIAKTDIVAELTPAASDPFVQSFLNKFRNTDLEKILRDKGIKTIIAVGLAANGAVIDTSSQAAQMGFDIVVALDGVTGMTTYPEQYTAWHLANAPVISSKITLTKSDMIKF